MDYCTVPADRANAVQQGAVNEELVMSIRTMPSGGAHALEEMREFATLPPACQRYIRRSLDVAFDRCDAVAVWSRNADEEAAIIRQRRNYTLLKLIRATLTDRFGLSDPPGFFGPLVSISARDLAEGKLSGFSAYRFLYERLLGGIIRPWLASSFLAAAVLPSIPTQLRRQPLHSLVEDTILATMWPAAEPQFFPQWVEKA